MFGKVLGWLLLPVTVLMAAGCNSSPPCCTDTVVDVANLKTDVGSLVARNGPGSWQPALDRLQINTQAFTADANSAFRSQTAALQDSLAGLATAVKSARGVVPAVTRVKISVSSLQTAVASKSPHSCVSRQVLRRVHIMADIVLYRCTHCADGQSAA
jgi:hypothetical protein